MSNIKPAFKPYNKWIKCKICNLFACTDGMLCVRMYIYIHHLYEG